MFKNAMHHHFHFILLPITLMIIAQIETGNEYFEHGVATRVLLVFELTFMQMH